MDKLKNNTNMFLLNECIDSNMICQSADCTGKCTLLCTVCKKTRIYDMDELVKYKNPVCLMCSAKNGTANIIQGLYQIKQFFAKK
jgi:hypothetical protein